MKVLVISGSRARLPDPVYPLGAAIIGTAVQEAGHQVSWFDALQHKEPVEVLAETVASLDPDALLFSIRNIDSAAFPSPDLYFEDHLPLVEACRRGSAAPVVLGGSAFSLMPEAFMELLGADHGVVGDGEAAVVELLDALESGRECRPIYRPGPVSSSSFVVADRALFDADWYYVHGGVANVQTKRGCPERCVYCTYPFLEGRRPRQVEPGAVVDELESIVSKGIRHFFFVDAVFNASESHAAEVCREIIRRGLDISFAAYLSPRSELAEFPDLLKRAGCTAAELGTDALDDSMLDSYRKGFTVSDALSFSMSLKALEIPQCHNLILGGPGETAGTMEASVARLDEINPTAVIVTVGLRVFPGTELAAIAADKVGIGDGDQLEPVFYIEEAVADTIVERAAEWIDPRRGWICPGLGKRCNPRYLERLRMHRGRKGVLWTMF